MFSESIFGRVWFKNSMGNDGKPIGSRHSLLRVRSPLVNPPCTAGSIPSCQSKCAGFLLRRYTRLGNVACLLSAVHVHGCSGKPSMPVSRALNPISGYMDAQGNLLCLSRAPQGPLLALWGTWIRRETFYADLRGT